MRAAPWKRCLAATAAFLPLLTAAARARAEDTIETCVSAAERAQSLRSRHQLRAAREQLLTCSQAKCPAVVRADCAQWLSEVEAALPTLAIRARDGSGRNLVNVRVLVDGVELTSELDGVAIAVDPGVHVFRLEATGMPAVDAEVVISEGEKRRLLEVKLGAGPASSPAAGTEAVQAESDTSPSVLPYVLGGVGVVGIASFAYFGLTGHAEASDLAAGCGATKSCRADEVDPVRTKLIVADVSLGVGLVSLGVATWLFISNGGGASEDRAKVEVDFGPNYGSIGFSRRF